jgi:D-3-phosphoglycerate dehydrogenase
VICEKGTMTTIYVSEPIDPDVLARLRDLGTVHLGYGEGRVDYAAIAETVDATMLRVEKFGADRIVASPNLKVIARHGVGTDNVDIEAATEAGVWVTTTPGANSRAVAEHVFALTLSLARKTVAAATGTADGHWASIKPALTGFQLHGRTLGLLGFGSIAKFVAEIAHGFGMTVIVTDPYASSEDIVRAGARAVSFDDLIAESDVLSLHVPLTEGTRKIIDEPAIKAMRPGAVLINTSRGELLDETALLAALVEERIGGAGLDVLEAESVNGKDPIAHSTFTPEVLRVLDNLILTPHMAGQTQESLAATGAAAFDNIAAVLAGHAPPNPVNSIAGTRDRT